MPLSKEEVLRRYESIKQSDLTKYKCRAESFADIGGAFDILSSGGAPVLEYTVSQKYSFERNFPGEIEISLSVFKDIPYKYIAELLINCEDFDVDAECHRMGQTLKLESEYDGEYNEFY